MKKTMVKMAMMGACLGISLYLTGCGTITFNDLTLYKSPGGWQNPLSPNATPPPPSGSTDWNAYASSNDIVPNSSVNTDDVPPPSGYSSWSDFNNDPSVSPPSGNSSWSDWAGSVEGTYWTN